MGKATSIEEMATSSAIGMPASLMQLPVVDIVEVGTGGGSHYTGATRLAVLPRVGPTTRALTQGPAAYGKGAFNPVITDANLVLGEVKRREVSEWGTNGCLLPRAIAKRLRSPQHKRRGIRLWDYQKIADAAMSLAVRAVSVDKGIDPHDTVMIALGGAGPLHAVAIAREIFILQGSLLPNYQVRFRRLAC